MKESATTGMEKRRGETDMKKKGGVFPRQWRAGNTHGSSPIFFNHVEWRDFTELAEGIC